MYTLSLSLTEHKHPPHTHSHNESQPCASQVKGAPGELWASEQPSCSKAPGGHLEEWLLYDGEIMGKKCSTLMNWSWSSLSFNNRLVYLSSHFPKKMPHQPIFMLQIIAYFSLLFPPFANSTQSCLVLERFSRYQEGLGKPSFLHMPFFLARKKEVDFKEIRNIWGPVPDTQLLRLPSKLVGCSWLDGVIPDALSISHSSALQILGQRSNERIHGGSTT